MANESRSRVVRFGLSAIVLSVAVAACDLVPHDGYDKLPVRHREPVAEAAAPPPPPYMPIAASGAAAGPQLAAGATPAGVTQEMVEQGAQQFGTLCAACHGAGGTGTAAAPALNDAEWLHISGDYEQIVEIINTGVPAPMQFPAPMPPRGGGPFSDEQVRQLAAYVFALSHAGS